ncbi:MAG: transcriptional repressor, partial [Nitrospinota bacterium]
RLLVERVASVPDHFDAEDLYVQLRTEGLPVSRATLYRTLDVLVEVGYLRRITLERGKAHYERREGEPPPWPPLLHDLWRGDRLSAP